MQTYWCVISPLCSPLSASIFFSGPEILPSLDCANVRVTQGRTPEWPAPLAGRCASRYARMSWWSVLVIPLATHLLHRVRSSPVPSAAHWE